MLRAANKIVLDVLGRIFDNLGCSELMLYRILARFLFLPRLAVCKQCMQKYSDGAKGSMREIGQSWGRG